LHARENFRSAGGADWVATTAAAQEIRDIISKQNGSEPAPGPAAQTLYGPMLFLQFSNLPLIADLLRTRIERETESIRTIAKIRKQLGSIPATGALHLMKHLELQHRLDRKWLQGVLADVEGGRVRDVEDRKRLTRGSLASNTRRRPHSSGTAIRLK